jgi:RNA polymerase-binding transcription factor DksA
MNAEKLKKYEKSLLAEMEIVQKELQSVGRKNPDNPNDWEALPEKMDILNSDDNEVADGIEAYEENTAILKQLEIRYNEIKDALEKINNGNFGKCSVCQKEIETERLDVNPGAKTCLAHVN